jgi:cytosolic carboxypeptidase protein 2/3|tara:strand:+ start:620 stop:748 length:129 start_codon:yes stop_codon:yes gene_type:complete
LGSASYLINIKKLIEEHNIDGEKRDFKSMKTKSMGAAGGTAP